MGAMTEPGWIVVLNGAPRSGKSTIAAAVQDRFDGPWMHLGVDLFGQATPARYRPGIGLRPGGKRPEVEALVPVLAASMYASVAAHSRSGLHVVVDVGHHEAYSRPLGVLAGAARLLDGLPAYLVGVRCPVEEIMRRRDAGHPGREGQYLTSSSDGTVPEPVLAWQREVHRPGIYDLEVDTSVLRPDQCADAIRRRLDDRRPPTAFARLREGDG